MRLLFLLIAPYLLFITPALAKTIVLKVPQASAKEYQAFVLSSPAYEFPSHILLNEMPSTEDREHLSALFAKAQASYTDGSLNQAKEDYKQVVALAETDQWGEEEQSVLLHSYLRLAQLEQNADVINELLKKAVAWTPRGKLDETFFPPPLVQQFRQLQSSTANVAVDLRPFADDFNFVVVNGQSIDLAKTKQTELKDGPVRATFISDTYQPSTVQLSADQLSQAQPEKRAWVEGSCLKPQLRWQHAGQLAKPFFNQNCAPMKAKESTEIDVAYHAPIAVTHSEANSLPLPGEGINTSKAHVPFYEKSWFWIGVGVVATAVVVVALSNSHSSSHPTAQVDFQ